MKAKYLFISALLALVVTALLSDIFGKFWPAIPTVIVTLYIIVGTLFKDKDLTQENFGDLCYYIGLFATFVSFFVCLYAMQGQGLSSPDMVKHIGAALITTVLGLVVRLYYVGFKPASIDEYEKIKREAHDATRILIDKLGKTVNSLQEFNSHARETSEDAITLISKSAKTAASNVSSDIAQIISALTQANGKAITEAMSGFSEASKKLSQSVNSYTDTVESHLRKGIVLPDEILKEPLNDLVAKIGQTAQDLKYMTDGLGESVDKLHPALNEMRSHSSGLGETLKHVIDLAKEQESLMARSREQNGAMETIVQTLNVTQENINQVSTAVAEQTDQLSKFMQNSADTTHNLAKSLKSHVTDTRNQYKEMTASMAFHAETMNHHTEALNRYVTSSQQQQDNVAAALEAQKNALAEEIKISRDQYDATSEILKTQSEELKQNIAEQTRLSSSVYAQTEALTQKIDASDKHQTALSEMAIAQSRALTDSIESQRQQQEAISTSFANQTNRLTKYIDDNTRHYVDVSAAVVTQGETLKNYIEGNLQRQDTVLAEISAQGKALGQNAEQQAHVLASVQSQTDNNYKISTAIVSHTKSLANYVESSQKKLANYVENSQKHLLDASNAIVEQGKAVEQQLDASRTQFAEQSDLIRQQFGANNEQFAIMSSALADQGKQQTDLTTLVNTQTQTLTQYIDSIRAQSADLSRHVEISREQYDLLSSSVTEQREALTQQIEAGQRQFGEIAQIIEISKQEHVKASNAVAEQSRALIRHVEDSRKQYDKMSATLREQVQSLDQSNQQLFSQVSSVTVAQTETMTRNVEQSRLIAAAFDTQNQALKQFIEDSHSQYASFAEDSRNQYADVANAVIAQGEIISQQAEANQQQYSAALSQIAEQSEALRQQTEASQQQYGKMSKTLIEQGDAISTTLREQKEISASVISQTDALEQYIRNNDKAQTDYTERVQTQLAQYVEEIKAYQDKIGETLAQQIDALAAQTHVIESSQKHQGELAMKVIAQDQTLTQQIEAAQKQYEDINSALAAQAHTLNRQIEKYAELAQYIVEGQKRDADILEEVRAQGETIAQQSQSLTRQIENNSKQQKDSNSTLMSQTAALAQHVETSKRQNEEAVTTLTAQRQIFEAAITAQMQELKNVSNRNHEISQAVINHGRALERVIGIMNEFSSALKEQAENSHKQQSGMIVVSREQLRLLKRFEQMFQQQYTDEQSEGEADDGQ